MARLGKKWSGVYFSAAGILPFQRGFSFSWDGRGGWGRIEGASPSPPTQWAPSQLLDLRLLHDNPGIGPGDPGLVPDDPGAPAHNAAEQLRGEGGGRRGGEGGQKCT